MDESEGLDGANAVVNGCPLLTKVVVIRRE
jgi:hypothetical protein